MRLKLITSKILCREVSKIIADCDNYIDVSYIRENYRNDQKKLHDVIQREIDLIETESDCYSSDESCGKFDAILLGFGLCSNSTTNITSKKYTVVMPRAHDCMTLLLGSSSRYREIFDECNGNVYWYTTGKMENALLPCKATELLSYKNNLEKYGAANASYLAGKDKMALLSYKRAAFIDTGIKSDECERLARDGAEYYGWEFKKYASDFSLLTDFLKGNWDKERFLKIPPTYHATQSFDETVIKAEK